jgi:hypothetical protein
MYTIVLIQGQYILSIFTFQMSTISYLTGLRLEKVSVEKKFIKSIIYYNEYELAKATEYRYSQ